MKLTTQQREALTTALGQAFPSLDELDQLTQFKLGTRLNQITAPAAHTTVVLRVVNWIEAHDKLFPDLIAGALNQNPENSSLQEVAREFGLDDGAGEFEARVLDKVPVNDVESWRSDMMRCERAVCRIELGGKAVGTGFLIGKQQVITNLHVIAPVFAGTFEPTGVQARFDYKLSRSGSKVQRGVGYRLAPGAGWCQIKSEVADLDFAVLRLAKKAADESVAGQHGAPVRGFLQLEAWEFKNGQPLFIIQHPDGSPLKFAAGTVTDAKVKPNRVAHNVTTEPGSSGSPCFTSDWKVVGLHHWGKEHDHNRCVTFSAILKKLKERGVTIST